jgi:hypothetical protein
VLQVLRITSEMKSKIKREIKFRFGFEKKGKIFFFIGVPQRAFYNVIVWKGELMIDEKRSKKKTSLELSERELNIVP